tara:strand:- start:89 stop:1735 length:1647 start_codon:yes stop_codon:yes gene_type:complete
MEARFIVGPPGTGKTHTWLVKKYEECFSKYTPEKIILLSHTNVAVDQISDAILDLKEVKEKGYRRKFFKGRISTIHSYCKNKLMGNKTLFSNEDLTGLCITENGKGFRQSNERDVEKHPVLRFIKEARGHERGLEEHWNHPHTDKKKLLKSNYNLQDVYNLNRAYQEYKNDKENRLQDYADMVDEFNSLTKESDVEVLIVDEAQDCNVPQLGAIKKIAKNVKDDHFYLVGDPDQTIHEYAGSDAKWFHEKAAKPFLELEQGLRCGRAINELCKRIINPVWKHFKYEGGGRKWLPAVYNKKYHEIPEGCKEGDTIEGNIYRLADFRPSKTLDLLIDKMRNTKQSFIFSFRGTPSDKRVTDFLKHHGFEYAHIDKGNSAHVSKKELRCHFEWPKFIEGEPKSLTQIKDFHSYLGRKVIMHRKGEYDYKDWPKKDYSYDDLITLGIFKPGAGKEFDLLITKQTDHDNRMIYIKKVIRNGFDPDGNIRIKYGNIHKVKGTTFDNVIGDLSTYRPEFEYAALRLLYTMFSRGIYDAWILNSSSGKELGTYVRR